jgi:hypothetical protein
MQEWYSKAQEFTPINCHAFYMDRRTRKDLLLGTAQGNFRKQLLLSDHEGDLAKRPVLFITGNDDGPNALVLLDYQANIVFIFGIYGRNLDDTIYITWDSSRYWKPIAKEMKWKVDDKEPKSFSLDWVQVQASTFHHPLADLASVGGTQQHCKHGRHNAPCSG